ncbi:hypothetical protein [Corallococcus macrosporus]|uniref:Uncharacterized protein n=1 Tax=Corallococcus macrosporus DSM 14697 TaxID=1189310 RepID=A0A250JT59_9BACT|nr:hypothetical protein [Corallococcus macrosporus]ATB46551.1 hypothetical protein MYMAC_002156 [Corallococcus macrosporus DSM 14697]
MHRLSLFVTVLLLTGAAHAADDAALWQAAYTLDKPGKGEAAEASLRQGGAAAYDVLTKLARVSGEERALAMAAGHRMCPMFLTHRMGMHALASQSRLPEKLSKLALDMLVQSPELRQRAASSAEPFDRALALLASEAVPDALPGAVERMGKEQEPWLVLWATHFVGCVTQQDRAKAATLNALLKPLSERAQALRDTKVCQEPAEVAPHWVELLASGTATVQGWSRNGDELRVPVSAGPGESLDVLPGCAVALYDAVAERGRYVRELLIPVATEQWRAAGARQAAGARAVKDLEHYPEAQRNQLAAKLVNAGFTVPVKVTFQTERASVQEEQLEAAARQGSQEAKAAILQAAFCRDSGSGSPVRLLGFVKGREAADLAHQLARKCPRALPDATAALVRLKDRRALPLLGPALAAPDGVRDSLREALMESLTPQVTTKLRALAAKKAAGAEEMVRVLTAAQVMRE